MISNGISAVAASSPSPPSLSSPHLHQHQHQHQATANPHLGGKDLDSAKLVFGKQAKYPAPSMLQQHQQPHAYENLINSFLNANYTSSTGQAHELANFSESLLQQQQQDKNAWKNYLQVLLQQQQQQQQNLNCKLATHRIKTQKNPENER